jgi:hypothetical protein
VANDLDRVEREIIPTKFGYSGNWRETWSPALRLVLDAATRPALRRSADGVDTVGRNAQAPADLAKRVQSSVRRATRAKATLRVRRGPLLAAAASLALITAAGWGLASVLRARCDGSFLTQELVAGHVRASLWVHSTFQILRTIS